jgi:hypothetical protein
MEDLGFFVCVADLEDELIRCLGDDAVEGVLEEQGDLVSFRTFQKQLEWRGRTTKEQLRRFLGTGSGRKIRTTALLVGALDLTRVPWPLDRVLAHVCGDRSCRMRSAVLALDQAGPTLAPRANSRLSSRTWPCRVGSGVSSRPISSPLRCRMG